MKGFRPYLICLLALFCALPLHGQKRDTSKSEIIVINARRTTVTKQPVETTWLTGDVIMRQDSAIFYADTVIKQGNRIRAFGNVIIKKGDSTSVFADSLIYSGLTRQAQLRGEVVLVNGKQQLFTESLHYNLNSDVATYNTGALLTNRESYLSSKRGYYNTRKDLAFFEDSVVVGHPKFTLRSDSMYFDATSQRALFVAPTRISQEDSEIYAEGGWFDLEYRNAVFTDNAQYFSGEKSALSDTIYYDDRSGKVRMAGNAIYREGNLYANASEITYWESSGQAIFAGDAFFRDSLRTASADTIAFNTRTESFETFGRTVLTEEGRTIRAGKVYKLKDVGLNRLEGNVLLQDSSEGFTMHSMIALHNDSTGYIKAFGDSTFIITTLDDDSLFMRADTIERIDRADSLGGEMLRAWHRVRIYKTNLQGVCDSLVYEEADSVFRMIGNPLLWSDTSQYKADTIFLKLKNDRIDQVILKGNAMIINSTDAVFFNQVKGRVITAYFREGEVDRVFVNGNAISVYYVLDEQKAYIGVNRVESSSIWIHFTGREVEDVKFYSYPDGHFYPMQNADHESLKLEGFKWYGERRPLDVKSLFVNVE